MLKNCSARTLACWLLGAGCLMGSWRAGSSQDFPYFVDRVPEEQLPQNEITALAQGSDGYLWLGTLYGLVRFDGMQCTVFSEANTPGMKSSQIAFLAEDSRTNLWVGTETAGVLLIHKDGSVQSLDLGTGRPHGRLASLSEDGSGCVWLNTLDGQVARFQNNSLEILNGQARPVIAEKFGPLWFGMGRGLVSMRSVSNSSAFFWEQEYPLQKLDYLFSSRTNGCWRMADGRVEKWTNGHLEKDWGPYPWEASQVNTACEDNDGNLVVGTQDKGVFWYTRQGAAIQISSRNGLSHDTVLSLCVDREGTLWVGTDSGGLNRVRPKLFDLQGDSLGRTIQSVCDDRQGGVWFANFGGKLSHLAGGVWKQYDVSEDPQNPYIRSVFVDRDRTVWVGTTLQGLFVQKGDSFQHVPESEAGHAFSAIYQDRSGRLWFGSELGLFCHEGQSWKVFTTRDGLSANSIRALAEDSDGNLWIGTDGGGLDCYRNGTFSAMHQDRGLPSESVTALLLDKEGTLWIGTRAGLARLHRNANSEYSAQQELVGNAVAYLVEDEQGYMWVGSNAGLIRVLKRNLAGGAVAARVYGRQDGLPTRECTQGSQPASCRTPDGNLWFSTIKGLVSATPQSFKPNPHAPPVVIESVRIDGQEQKTNALFAGSLQAVVVPPGKQLLEIRYTSLNLGTRDRAQFRYRLEGHEMAWIDAGTRPVAPFSTLSPGHYQFHVLACNEDGIWNEQGATLGIIVLPPFWQTWWFLSLSTILLLGLLIYGVRYISTQKLFALLKQQQALEKERGRIARDLHDQLGANLTQIAILGEMASGDKNIPEEVETHASQISQTARETTGALDEIVWAVNPSNDTLEGLIGYACKYAQDYFATAGLRHRLDVPTQLPNIAIPPELRHNVFLAFKEAVTNVVKHAQASEARVRLILEDRHFAIEIEDNGRGPKKMDAMQSRNGLRNMRKRMEDVGGQFSITPGPENGTVVRLSVPMKRSA